MQDDDRERILLGAADRAEALSLMLSRAVGARIWAIGVTGPARWVSLELGYPVPRSDQRHPPSRSLASGRQGSVSIFVDGPWTAYRKDSAAGRQVVDVTNLRHSFLKSYRTDWPKVALRLSTHRSDDYGFGFRDDFLIDFGGGREILVAETRGGEPTLERKVGR